MRQWNRFKSNSIMVEDSIIHMSDKRVPLVSYDKITYGVNINMKRKKITSLSKTLHCKEPNIGNIKVGYIFITANKKDILSIDVNTLIVDGSSQGGIDGNNESETTYHPSGIVVLMICRLENKKTVLDTHGVHIRLNSVVQLKQILLIPKQLILVQRVSIMPLEIEVIMI